MTEEDAHIEKVTARRWQAFCYFGLAFYLLVRLMMITKPTLPYQVPYVSTLNILLAILAVVSFGYFFVMSLYLMVKARSLWPVSPPTFRARFLFWPAVIAVAFEMAALGVKLFR